MACMANITSQKAGFLGSQYQQMLGLQPPTRGTAPWTPQTPGAIGYPYHLQITCFNKRKQEPWVPHNKNVRSIISKCHFRVSFSAPTIKIHHLGLCFVSVTAFRGANVTWCDMPFRVQFRGWWTRVGSTFVCDPPPPPAPMSHVYTQSIKRLHYMYVLLGYKQKPAEISFFELVDILTIYQNYTFALIMMFV